MRSVGHRGARRRHARRSPGVGHQYRDYSPGQCSRPHGRCG